MSDQRAGRDQHDHTAASPIGERTITIGDAYDDLDARLDDLADKLASVDADAPNRAHIRQEASDVQQRLQGVAYLREEYGDDRTVTVRGLDAGGFARVEDRIADVQAAGDGPGNQPGSRRNVFAATGLVDAPFVDVPDGPPRQRYERKLAAISNQPVGVAKWLEDLVDQETSIEGNWTPLRERLADRTED